MLCSWYALPSWQLVEDDNDKDQFLFGNFDKLPHSTALLCHKTLINFIFISENHGLFIV